MWSNPVLHLPSAGKAADPCKACARSCVRSPQPDTCCGDLMLRAVQDEERAPDRNKLISVFSFPEGPKLTYLQPSSNFVLAALERKTASFQEDQSDLKRLFAFNSARPKRATVSLVLLGKPELGRLRYETQLDGLHYFPLCRRKTSTRLC